MSAERIKKASDDQFSKITEQIKHLEQLISENQRDIKKFQEANMALKKTIEILKEERRVVIGIANRVSPLTYADISLVKKRQEASV